MEAGARRRCGPRLLATLVGLVRWNLHDAEADQRTAGAAIELRRSMQTALRHVREAQVGLRDVLLARDAVGTSASAATTQAASAQSEAILAAMERTAPEALRPDIAAAGQAAQGWAQGAAQVVALRRDLLTLRDERFYPLMSEYDQAFEAVVANLEFELQGDAREEARQRLLTFHAAVNDSRLGVQRFLETQEEAQARRVRRAGAQATVHFRGFASAARGPAAARGRSACASPPTSLSEAAQRHGRCRGEASGSIRREVTMPAFRRARPDCDAA